jgi:hypothetical protein
MGVRTYGERRVTASNWKFVVLLLGIFACAVTGWLAATDQSIASDDLKYIKSITFAGHTVDPAHSVRLQGWTIGFGVRRPFAEYSEQGTTLRGLSCASSKIAKMKCHLFMSMKPLESFPHFCELSPDDHAPGSWPMRINCPNEIKFYR